MNFKNIDAMIFDWDNTLFDFKKYWEISHRKVFFSNATLSKNLEYEDFMTVYRTNDEKLWKKVLVKEITIDELRIERFLLTSQNFGIHVTKEEAQLFFESFFKNLIQEIKPDIKLIKKISHLAKRYDVSILTNGKSVEQREKIKKSGFNMQIPLYISEEIGYEKPSLESFRYVISDRSLKPSNTIMIGDSTSNDILPAQKLGFKTVYIGNQRDSVADISFENVHEFLELIGEGSNEE